MGKLANIYKSEGNWFCALFADGEFDSCEILDDTETEAEARGVVRALHGSDCEIRRVSDVDRNGHSAN